MVTVTLKNNNISFHRCRQVPIEGPSMKAKLLTVSETAESLGLSIHTVRAWIAARRIAHVRLGRAVRVSTVEIDRLVSAGSVPATGRSERF